MHTTDLKYFESANHPLLSNRTNNG